MPSAQSKRDNNNTLARLADAFMPYITKRAQSYAVTGLDRDDLVQEGLLGLLRALETFDPDRGASFMTYARVCIGNGIASAVEAATAAKHSPLAKYVELDDMLADADILPQDAAEQKESLESLLDSIEKKLSETEKAVIACRMSGYTYAQIAEKLSISEKSVDNALSRARRKLK